MSKKNNKENKDKLEKNKCQCENENCTCGDNCECGDDCHCGENCECDSECQIKYAFTTEQLYDRIKVLEDALLRSQAELLNYRKRKDEETSRILKYAEEDVLKSFLPILDNFERAIMMDDNNFGDEASKFLEGFRLVYNQTKSMLEKFEVKEIDCLDKEFDPAIEQAISTEKNKDKPSGTVLKVYQKGYMYKDKVLRLAMVIVNE